MSGWSAGQYLEFAEERTRPARDLLAQVRLDDANHVVDLGCGPANSTELLVERFPQAEIVGVDSSHEMLDRARRRRPQCRFIEADIATWVPEKPDLIFANAVFQWVPDHALVLKRLCSRLAPGGVLALQMPDNLNEAVHVLMRETAADQRWAKRLASAVNARRALASPEEYYDLLKPGLSRVDIWQTTYNHPLAGGAAIVEWMKGTGLRPFLSLLESSDQELFLASYAARIAVAYPSRFDGKSLLRFPRLFIVAVK
jgi:trans-aconitate 2-methyltransferase